LIYHDDRLDGFLTEFIEIPTTAAPASGD